MHQRYIGLFGDLADQLQNGMTSMLSLHLVKILVHSNKFQHAQNQGNSRWSPMFCDVLVADPQIQSPFPQSLPLDGEPSQALVQYGNQYIFGGKRGAGCHSYTLRLTIAKQELLTSFQALLEIRPSASQDPS